jgi:hypothetical protein
MPLNEEEAARAVELRKSIEDFQPLISDGQQRSNERRKWWRRTGAEIASQAISQAIGTLAAAGIAYLIAVTAGALEGTRPLTIIVTVIMIVGTVGAFWWPARYLFSSIHRAEAKVQNASLELINLEVRAKLRDREPLTELEARLIQMGLIRLDG